MNINDLLKIAVERKSSDLHLKVGSHPVIRIDGDRATGRAYMQEIARAKSGFQGLNYAIYHDSYRRTDDGWKFSERVYEIRYLDTTPLTGSAPAGDPRTPQEAR